MKLTFQSPRAHTTLNGKREMLGYIRKLVAQAFEDAHGHRAWVVLGPKGRAWDVEIEVKLREK